MSRRDFELELLSLKFKNYTDEVRQAIAKIAAEYRCDDTSDTVVDGLWESCRDDMIPVLTEQSIRIFGDDVAEAATLSIEGREALRCYINQARDYEAALIDSDDDVLEILFRSIVLPIHKAKRDQRVLRERGYDRWAFFNLPDAEADFGQWQNRLLRPAQAVSLSFGKDPDVVTPESLKPYRQVIRSPFREAYKDRLELLEGAIAAGELAVPLSISDFEKWAISRGIQLPAALTGNATSTGEKDLAYWKQRYESAESALEKLRQSVDDMYPKSRSSLYMMILGMAVTRFGHKTTGNSKATSAIRGSIDEIGLKIDDATILGHLRDAANELDFTWPSQIRLSDAKRTTS